MESIIFGGQIEAIYKIIVIGDPDVGKTSLLENFASNQFGEKYLPTVGVSILKESIELEDRDATISLMFWDIAAQPQFYELYRPYFNGADGMLLVFDITRSSTFSNINNWHNLAVKYGLSRIPKILIGNKAHLEHERRIILPMAEHLSQKINAPYIETSNVTGQNVKYVFKKMAELIYLSKLYY
jgi:small GTP-binding protein